MTEEDFVFAWLLAVRANGNEWGGAPPVIAEAKRVYKLIKERVNEADSRTED